MGIYDCGRQARRRPATADTTNAGRLNSGAKGANVSDRLDKTRLLVTTWCGPYGTENGEWESESETPSTGVASWTIKGDMLQALRVLLVAKVW